MCFRALIWVTPENDFNAMSGTSELGLDVHFLFLSLIFMVVSLCTYGNL